MAILKKNAEVDEHLGILEVPYTFVSSGVGKHQ